MHLQYYIAAGKKHAQPEDSAFHHFSTHPFGAKFYLYLLMKQPQRKHHWLQLTGYGLSFFHLDLLPFFRFDDVNYSNKLHLFFKPTKQTSGD